MKLPPGVDIAHAAVWVGRNDNVRHIVEDRKLEQRIWFVVLYIQALGEIESGWIEHWNYNKK